MIEAAYPERMAQRREDIARREAEREAKKKTDIDAQVGDESQRGEGDAAPV